MSLHDGSVFSRLSRRSNISDSSPLAVHLSNDNAMRKLLRDGIGITELQKKYLSLCYDSRPNVRPNKDVAQRLGKGELVWHLIACEKQDTDIIAALLTTKEAYNELRSVVISGGEASCPSVRKRNGTAARSGGRKAAVAGGSRSLALERDSTGQVELFNTLCKALPRLEALMSLELVGLQQGFQKSGAGAARLARGLVGNKTLKSLLVRHVCLTDPRAVSAFSSALAAHPSLVTLSLRHCGLTGEPGGRLVASVIRAHAARREGMVWSAGLRRPLGSVGTTVAAAPAEIARAGCLAVDLGDNHLGDAGVHAVARSLQSDTWLVGLNLSSNEVTDRGAALLSVCLQHNSTLCALVLDRNPAISTDAVHRITAELGTRNTMPMAIMEEREAILTLAAWGFRAHGSCDDDGDGTAPLLPERQGSVSAVSEFSEEVCLRSDAFHPDSLVAERHLEYNRGETKTRAARQQYPASDGLKEELLRAFSRQAGYSSAPSSIPPELSVRSTRYYHDNGGKRTCPRQPLSEEPRSLRANVSDTPATTQSTATRTAAAGFGVVIRQYEGRSTSDRVVNQRSRSVSRSSPLTRSNSSNGSVRLAKRNKSSGPYPGRDILHGRSENGPGIARSSTRVVSRTPWGAGPRIIGGARERAQAWASAELEKVRSSDSASGRGNRRRARCRGASAGGDGGISNRMTRDRSRIRRGCELGRRPGKKNSSDRKSRVRPVGGDKTRRGAAAEELADPRRGVDVGNVIGGNRNSDGDACAAAWRQANMREVAVQVPGMTECVVGAGGGYRELAPRQQGRGLRAGAESVAAGIQHGGNSADVEGDKTNRVVSMLATLEDVVMKICQDMWRLEDRLQDLDGRASPLSVQPGEAHIRERGAISVTEGGGNLASQVEDGRREVANQVAARLRDMWHPPPNDNDDHAELVRAERDRRERVTGRGRADTAESDVSPLTETGWRAVKDLIEREEGETAFGASAGGKVEPADMSGEAEEQVGAGGGGREEKGAEERGGVPADDADLPVSSSTGVEGWGGSACHESNAPQQETKTQSGGGGHRVGDEKSRLSPPLVGMEGNLPFTVAVPVGVAVGSPPSRVHLAVHDLEGVDERGEEEEEEEEEDGDATEELGTGLDEDVSFGILSA